VLTILRDARVLTQSCRPSFDQILVELKRMREKWSGTGSSNSSFTEGPATPLQATQAGFPVPQPHTLLRWVTCQAVVLHGPGKHHWRPAAVLRSVWC
jgi:hypothetical protein